MLDTTVRIDGYVYTERGKMELDREGVLTTVHSRKQLIQERIELAAKLLTKAQQLKHGAGIKGFQRIERKIKAEKTFLESVRRSLPTIDMHTPPLILLPDNAVKKVGVVACN